MASVGCFIQRRLVLHRLAAVRRWVASIPRSEKLVAGVMRKERRPMKYRLASQTMPSIYDWGRRLSRGEDSRQFVSAEHRFPGRARAVGISSATYLSILSQKKVA